MNLIGNAGRLLDRRVTERSALAGPFGLDSPMAELVRRTDITPPEVEARNLRPGLVERLTEHHNNVMRTLSLRLPCFPNLPCSFQKWCCPTSTSWVPPDIKGQVYPSYIYDVTIRPFKGRIDGTARAVVHNQSTEGKRIDTTVCRCKGGQEGRTETIVRGSAQISHLGSHFWNLRDIQDEALEKFQDALHASDPNTKTQIEASFQRSGLGAVFNALWDVIKGWWTHVPSAMRVKVHINAEWHASWLGKDLQKNFAFDIPEVELPVRNGGFHFDWSLF